MSSTNLPSPTKYVFKPGGGVAVATIVLLVLSMTFQVGILAGELVMLRSAVERDVDRAENGLVIAALTVLAQFFLVTIPLIVFLCIWTHRVAANVRALGADGLRYSPAWAVGWFFIPLANLVVPYGVFREIDRASQATGYVDREAWKGNTPGVVVTLWWIAWFSQTIVQGASNVLTRRFPQEMSTSVTVGVTLDVAASVILLGAGMFAILMIRRIDRLQVESWQARAQLAPPTP
ncbi:MAG: DUF4328 domain-containing protein [Phycisphaerales bacterium]|jgi:hypothetical protein